MGILTLKTKNVKEVIANRLGEKLGKNGFIYKKANNEFRHQKEDYLYIYYIDQIAWNNSFSLHVKLQITSNTN